MKKNKKSLKGMTLIEVLVSLAVFAMLSAILLGYGAYVDSTSKATRTMKNKVVEEAHYAASRRKEYSDGVSYQPLDSVTAQITITMDGQSGTFVPFIDNDPTKGYDNDNPISYNDPSTMFGVEIYSTEKAYEQALREKGYTDAEITAAKDKANGKTNINFVDDTNLSGDIISRSH